MGVKFNINKKSGTILKDSSTFLFILSQKWRSQGIQKGKYSVCYTKYFESTKSLYRFSSILQNRSHIVARPSYQIIHDRNQRFCSRGK